MAQTVKVSVTKSAPSLAPWTHMVTARKPVPVLFLPLEPPVPWAGKFVQLESCPSVSHGRKRSSSWKLSSEVHMHCVTCVCPCIHTNNFKMWKGNILGYMQPVFGFGFGFKIRFLCVALAVLELCRPIWSWTNRSTCLCLSSAGIKGAMPSYNVTVFSAQTTYLNISKMVDFEMCCAPLTIMLKIKGMKWLGLSSFLWSIKNIEQSCFIIIVILAHLTDCWDKTGTVGSHWNWI